MDCAAQIALTLAIGSFHFSWLFSWHFSWLPCLLTNSHIMSYFVSVACVLYFCWTALILLMYMYMCIFGLTFYCCYKPLPLFWAFAVLWSFPFLFPFFLSSSFFNFFSLFYNFNFLTYYIFSTFIPLFAFPVLLLN